MRGAPHNGSLDSYPESSGKCLRPRSVFPDVAVIFASSTKRTPGGAKRSLYRGERCADYGANRATIARARPTRAGRSAGGADEATRSFGKRRVGDEARGSPPVVRNEFESWTLPERKGRRKESSSRYHQDLMNARNLCIFSSDGDFGNHRRSRLYSSRLFTGNDACQAVQSTSYVLQIADKPRTSRANPHGGDSEVV